MIFTQQQEIGFPKSLSELIECSGEANGTYTGKIFARKIEGISVLPLATNLVAFRQRLSRHYNYVRTFYSIGLAMVHGANSLSKAGSMMLANDTLRSGENSLSTAYSTSRLAEITRRVATDDFAVHYFPEKIVKLMFIKEGSPSSLTARGWIALKAIQEYFGPQGLLPVWNSPDSNLDRGLNWLYQPSSNLDC